MCWEYLVYDSHYGIAFSEIPEEKTSKSKTVPFCAGAARNDCWLLDLGDYLMWMGLRAEAIYDESRVATWIFGDILECTQSPGTHISNLVKDFRADSPQSEYHEYAAEVNLPERATAGACLPDGTACCTLKATKASCLDL